jgi:hypothetical protein
VLRDVTDNVYTKEPVELPHRPELILVEELVLEFFVLYQFGWMNQNKNIINIEEDNKIIIGKEAWNIWNLLETKVVKYFGQILVP